MSDYTAEEITTAVTYDGSWSDLGYGGNVTVTLRGEQVTLEWVTGKPPHEGGGEDVYLVLKAGSQFFRKEGWYASYDGANWDGDLREVHPETREVTFYE